MSKNSVVVPEAREALDKFKMEAANEVGVDLKQGYNGHLTSREAGSVGGQMVKKMIEQSQTATHIFCIINNFMLLLSSLQSTHCNIQGDLHVV